MAVSRTARIDAEIERAKTKIIEQQGRLKELEQKRRGIEDMEIVDIVRGLRIPLDQLAAMLQDIKNGGGSSAGGGTSRQFVAKSAPVKKEAESIETESKEDENE